MKRLVFVVGVVACLMVDLRLQAQVGTFRRLVDLVQAVTIADNGGGTPATATVAPNSRYIAITCSDVDGCAVTLGETGIVNGQQLYIANISANAVTFADSAGVQELTSSVSLAQWTSMECEYLTDRWGCGGSGGGAGTVTTTGSPASGNLAVFSGASSITSSNLTGAVTTSGTVATTLAADIVGNTNLRNSGALSVIGRSANSTGDPADISASAASDAVLRESGSTVGFGSIATAGIANGAVTLPKIVDATAATRIMCRGSAAGSGDWEECTLGTAMSMSGTVISSSATGSGAFTASIYLHYRDEEAQNTDGGTFTLGAWRTRVLNTEVSDVGGLGSLASNQITLTAGDYLIRASAPAHAVGRHQLRLQNVTDATTVLTGQSSYSNAAGNGAAPATLVGKFTIAGSKALELQHQGESTTATTGFGVASNFTTEVYAVVELWKIG